MAVRYNPKTGRMESYDEEDDTIDTSTTSSESSGGTSGYDGRLRWNPETNRLESVYADDDPNDPYYKQAQEEQKRVKSAEIMKPVRDQEADMSKYGLKAIQTGTPVDQLKEEDRRRNEGSIFEKLYQGALDIANNLRENTTSYNYADEVAKYKEGETKEEYDARQLQYQNDSVWVDKELQQIRKSISEKEQQIKTNAELYGNIVPITDPKYKEATTFENQIHTQKEVEQLKEMESIYMQYLGQMETKRDILAAIQREFSIGQREEKLPLIGGFISIGDTLKTKDILEKESKGEDLTDEELIYARNAKSKIIEQRLNYGYGETIGSIVANAPTFALEFMLTSGLAGVGKSVGTKVVGEVAEQGVQQGIKLSAKRVAQNLVTNIFGEVTRLPAFMGRISNNAALYTTPKYDVVLGEDGDSLLKKLDEGDDWATAIAKATGSQLVENISESAVGNFVEDIGVLSKKALLGKFLQKVEDNPLKYGLDAGTKVTKGVADKVLDTMGWNGIAAEVLEEEFAEPFQAGIEGREYKDPLSSEEGRTRLFLEAIGIGFLGTIYQVPNFVLSKNIDARKKYESQAGPEIIDVPEHETIVNDPQIIKQVEEAMNPDNAAEPINTQISEDSNIKDGVVESSSKASNATLEKITQSEGAPDVKVSQLEQLISDIDSGKYNDDVAQTTKKIAEMELGGLKNKLNTQQVKNNQSTDSQLIEEAKKYKTAEEFVRVQGTPLLHGTTQEFESFDIEKAGTRSESDQGFAGKGIYLTNSKEVAEIFSNGEDMFGGKPGKPRIVEAYLKSDAKILEVSDYNELNDKLGLERTSNRPKGVKLFDFAAEQAPLISRKARELGYDAIKIDGGEVDKYGQSAYEIAVINPDVVKTKEELTNIWNKANTETTEDPLIEEARKYKTANEFYLRMSDSTRDTLRNKGIRGEEAIADYWNTNVTKVTESSDVENKMNKVQSYKLDTDILYHGTALDNRESILSDGFKLGSELPEDAYRGGGYGAMQDSISFSIDPKISARFATGSKGTVIEAKLKSNAKVVTIDGVDYAEDLNDMIPDLKKQGIDAVYLEGEKEVVVLDKSSISITGNYKDFKSIDASNIDFGAEFGTGPLVEEAKKFKTAEEFVKSELSKDKLVTVYRGSKTGKVHSDIKDFTFFATNPEYAKQYMTKGEKLVEYKLPESSLLRDEINDQEVQYLVDSRNPRIKQFIDIWNKANARQVEDGTLTLYNGSNGKVSEVQKSYKNILVSETNQSELLQLLADDGDARAKELLQGRINFVEADKYLRDKYKGEIDAIQYNNSDRPMLGKEYHDMKDGKFYAEDKEHAKMYSLQSRGEKYKKENKQDNISNNLQNDKTTEKAGGDKEEKKFFAKGDIFDRAENEIESLKEELDPESYEALSYAVEESKRIREESALEIINELEGAMAGFRYAVRDEDSMDLEYKGQKSTFPDWFSLRTRVEIDDFIAKMPENPSEWTLENNPFREGTKKYDSWVEMVNKLDNVSIREVLEGERDMIEDAIGMTIEQLDNKVSSILGDKTPAKKLSTKESPVSQGLNKLKESKAYTRIEEDLPEEIKAKDKPYYEVMNLAENNARALEIIDNDYNRAKRIALGHEATPEGVTQVAIATAVAAKAEMDGDYALMSRVASRISLIGTRMGQEIVSFRARLDKTQASDFIQEVIDRKIDSKYKKARKIIFKTEEDIEQNTPRKQAVKEIDREKKEAKKFLDVKQIKIKSAQEIIDLLTCEL